MALKTPGETMALEVEVSHCKSWKAEHEMGAISSGPLIPMVDTEALFVCR